MKRETMERVIRGLNEEGLVRGMAKIYSQYLTWPENKEALALRAYASELGVSCETLEKMIRNYWAQKRAQVPDEWVAMEALCDSEPTPDEQELAELGICGDGIRPNPFG